MKAAPKTKRAALTIRTLPLADLKPHPRNPRRHPEPGTPAWETLKKSLAHDYFDPIVWNSRNGLLVSGHLRVKVLAELGMTEADCVVVDYDERTHLARMVAANKLSGEDVFADLADLLQELDAGDVDMALTGYDAAALRKIAEWSPDMASAEDVGSGTDTHCARMVITCADAVVNDLRRELGPICERYAAALA